MTKSRTGEASVNQMKSFEQIAYKREPTIKNEPISTITRSSKNFIKHKDERKSCEKFQRFEKRKMYPNSNSTYRKEKERVCFACGKDYPHKDECPAKGKRCVVCKELNHFAKSKFCKKRVNAAVSEHQDNVKDDSEDVNEEQKSFVFTNSTCNDKLRPMVSVELNGQMVSMLIDSGAQDNLIDVISFNKWLEKPELAITKTKLYAYNTQQEIPIIGEFKALVKCNGQECNAVFKVVNGKDGNLLSFSTARQLDLFNLNQFKPINERVKCCSINNRYQKIMDQYSSVFNDRVGRLKGYKVKLHIDQDIKPVQQPYRRTPYNLMKGAEEEIDQLIKNDLIEEPPGPTEWLSQMVVVPKEKKPGKVRITTDMRVANKAIIRERFATPTIEEIMYDLQGSTVFSELDLNKAFHQVELDDEDSKNITAFETSKGIFRFKVLNMGIHNASEYLQRAMKQKVLIGLHGVKSIHDNVIVYGDDRESHDKCLLELCERFKQLGMTVSRDNCKLGVFELNFFGLKISKDGIALGEDKIAALKLATQPATLEVSWA